MVVLWNTRVNSLLQAFQGFTKSVWAELTKPERGVWESYQWVSMVCLLDSDLQLKHERTIRLICTVNFYCGCSSPTKSIMHGACSVLLYVMSTLGCICCAFQETRLWTRETALCCVLGYCRCAKDSLVCIRLDWKLRDWHWVLRSSVMICSGNEMTWMRNSLWFCKLGFCKCYIWPGVSKLFMCFIQTAYLFKYSLIANGVECFQQNRCEARTCALLLALAFTRISSLVRRSKGNWLAHSLCAV